MLSAHETRESVKKAAAKVKETQRQIFCSSLRFIALIHSAEALLSWYVDERWMMHFLRVIHLSSELVRASWKSQYLSSFPLFQGSAYITCMPGPVRRWNYPAPLCLGTSSLQSLLLVWPFQWEHYHRFASRESQFPTLVRRSVRVSLLVVPFHLIWFQCNSCFITAYGPWRDGAPFNQMDYEKAFSGLDLWGRVQSNLLFLRSLFCWNLLALNPPSVSHDISRL